MGAHHDVDRAIGEAAHDGLTLLGANPASQELHRDVTLSSEHRVVTDHEARQVATKRREMLFGQNFGRRHQHALSRAIK